MLSDLTPEEFTALQVALEFHQMTGAASRPGEITYAELAEWYLTTPQDIRNEELCAIEKIRHALHI